jgi:hypothetical protein
VWTLAPVGSGQGLSTGPNGPASLQGGDDYRVLSAQVGGPFADALVGKLRQELQRIIAASGGVMPSKQLIFQALLLIARDYFVQANGGAVFDLVLRPIVERLISRLIDEHQQQLPVNPTPGDHTTPGTLPPGRYRIEGVIEITVTPQDGGTTPGTNPNPNPNPNTNPGENGSATTLPQDLKPVGDPDGALAPEID